MVEVKELTLENAREIYSCHKLKFVEDESKAICAIDQETVLGTCLYDINSGSITLRLIDPIDDITMADSMLRSALFIAANRGIMEAYFKEPVTAELIKKLGFLGSEKKKTIDITNIFNPCACK